MTPFRCGDISGELKGMRINCDLLSFNRFNLCNGSVFHGEGIDMAKESLVKIIKKLLNTTETLDFLLQIDEDDLRVLITCIRNSKEFENEKTCERRDSEWFYGKRV